MNKKSLIHGLNLVKFALGSQNPIVGPMKVQIEITHKCNSRCLTCGFWKKKDFEELGTEDWRSFIRQARELNVLKVSFTGGESLLRDDIIELVRYGKQNGLIVSINSNGMLLEDMANKLVHAKLDSIVVSLDSANPLIHDRNRGVDGAFSTTISGVKELLSYKNRPKIQLNMTLNRMNIGEIGDLVKLGLKLGVDSLTLEPAHSLDDFWSCPESLRMRKRELGIFNTQLQELIKKHPKLLVPPLEYYKKFETFFIDPESLKKYRCLAGYGFITIAPNGDVYSCPAKEVKLGNIKIQEFRNLWYSQKFFFERTRIKDGDHLSCWFNSTGPYNLAAYYLKSPFKINKFINTLLNLKKKY